MGPAGVDRGYRRPLSRRGDPSNGRHARRWELSQDGREHAINRGAHVILYSSDAAADRAFLRDAFGWSGVDASTGRRQGVLWTNRATADRGPGGTTVAVARWEGLDPQGQRFEFDPSPLMYVRNLRGMLHQGVHVMSARSRPGRDASGRALLSARVH